MEGLYGQFCTAVHNPTANPSHLWEPQAAHGTEKKVGRRGGGGDHVADEEEDSGE